MSTSNRLTSADLPPVQPHRNLYPCCVVWTPLPVITWILPFVGHMGICDSQGVIHDFAGPYFVNIGNMAFGDPVKYWRIPLQVSPQEFDAALQRTTEYYRTRMYNFFCNNCHSMVATCLDQVPQPGSWCGSWNMVVLAVVITARGRYISLGAFLRAHLPTLFIILGVVLWSVFK